MYFGRGEKRRAITRTEREREREKEGKQHHTTTPYVAFALSLSLPFSAAYRSGNKGVSSLGLFVVVVDTYAKHARAQTRVFFER